MSENGKVKKKKLILIQMIKLFSYRNAHVRAILISMVTRTEFNFRFKYPNNTLHSDIYIHTQLILVHEINFIR